MSDRYSIARGDSEMAMVLSPKQAMSIRTSNHRFNWWVGAIRSGKTIASGLRWVKYAASEAPQQGVLVMAGRTQSSIVENVLWPLADFCGYDNVIFQRNSPEAYVMGRRCLLFGASDVRSEARLRGLTCAGAFLDEVTLLQEPFVRMLFSRMSLKGAKLFGSTNADSPNHWLKKDIIDNEELDQIDYRFLMRDNPALTPDFIENISKENVGVWNRRFVQGEWTAVQGAVYDMFCDDHIVPANYEFPVAEEYIVSQDYGTSNATCFLLLGINRKATPPVWVEREYYWDSREKGHQKSDEEYVNDLKVWLGGTIPSGIYCDPSAASFISAMGKSGFSQVYAPPEKSVIEGIRIISNLLAAKKLIISETCTNLINSLYAYSWDARAQARGEDKPLKENDHACDSLRYGIVSRFGGSYVDYSILNQW